MTRRERLKRIMPDGGTALITAMAAAIGPEVDIGDGRNVLIHLHGAGFSTERQTDDACRLIEDVIERVRARRAEEMEISA